MLRTCLFILLLGLYFLHITDGCGRSPKLNQQTTDSPVTASPPGESEHQLNCTVNETWSTACLNDGECFVYLIEDVRKAQCKCPEKYNGNRCQFFDITYGWQNEDKDRLATAGIAVSVVAVILFVAVLSLIFIWHKNHKKRQARKREKEKEKEKEQQNGTHHNLISSNTENADESPPTPLKNGPLRDIELQPLRESPV